MNILKSAAPDDSRTLRRAAAALGIASSALLAAACGTPPPFDEPPEAPRIGGAKVYRGTVASLDSPGGISGVAVEARIGSAYTSKPAVVELDSTYLLLVDPPDSQAAELHNQDIEFSIVGMPEVKAFQTRRYIGIGSDGDLNAAEELNLVFPSGVGEDLETPPAPSGSPPPSNPAASTLQQCATSGVPSGVPSQFPNTFQLSGEVTVPGATPGQVDGLRVQVRISSEGTQCIAGDFTVGDVNLPPIEHNLSTSGRYEVRLEGNPALYAGGEITFHLVDGTTANETEVYVGYEGYPPSCIVREGTSWGVETANCVRIGPRDDWNQAVRIQNLTFPYFPSAITPRLRGNVFFGSAFSPSFPGGLDGVRISARVGSYTTPEPALVVDGLFRLTVDPNDADLVGQPVDFFYEGAPELRALWGTVAQPRFRPSTMKSLVLNLPDPPFEEPNRMQIYRGWVASLDSPGGITGVAVEARIGTVYTSAPAAVGTDSSYLLVVDPPESEAAELLNQDIEFNIVGMPGVKAFQTRLYTGAGLTEELNLVFPAGTGEGR